MNEQILSGKVAIVTGATGERGRAIALALARAGASLTLASRNLRDLQDAGEEIQTATGAAPYLYGLDITQEDEVEECFAKVAQRFGELDILVNGASQLQTKDSLSLTKKDIQNLLLTNLIGTLFCCREAAKIMSEKKSGAGGGGNIINLVCLDEESGASHTAGYYASKTGVIGLTQALAREWQHLHVCVNAMVAGLKDDTFLEFAATEKNVQDFPRDIGSLCVWLSSDAASFITGRVIPVKSST